MSADGSLCAGRIHAPWELAGLEPHTPVLVAFSGGADSAALLALLAERGKQDGFSVTALHVNHGIRGDEADRDEAFCRGFAARLGVAFGVRRADVPALARAEGKGLEEVARAVRYRFFAEEMEARQIPLLATAHHADDNLETVLFRLARGSGLHGLCGIPPVRRLGGGFVTRPLLPYTKEEILAYCRMARLDFVTDSTNLEPSCTRNRLRLEILPRLGEIVPAAGANCARTVRSLAADADCLDRLAAQELERRRSGGGISLRDFAALHPALRARVLAGFCGGCEAVHLEAIGRLIDAGRGGTVLLPGDRYACVCGGVLRVFPVLRGDALEGTRPLREEVFSLCDGKLTVSVRWTEKCAETEKVHNLSTTHYIIPPEKSDIINQFFWKSPDPGDRMRVGGISRRAGKLLRERGIPAPVRRKLPVLCNAGGEIVWIPFAEARETPPEGGAYQITVSLGGAGRKNTTEPDDGGNEEDVRDQSGY